MLRTKVRGRRIDMQAEEQEEPQMFAMGNDADFQGFQEATAVHENYMDAVAGGRNIEMEDILNEVDDENAVTFDRDIGESSEDDE